MTWERTEYQRFTSEVESNIRPRAFSFFRCGYVDLLFTMDYEMSPKMVEDLERNYAEQIPNDKHGVGLAIYMEFAGSFPVSRSPKQVLSQMKVLRKLEIKHIVLFRHGFNNSEIIEALVNGPFREKAVPYYRKK